MRVSYGEWGMPGMAIDAGVYGAASRSVQEQEAALAAADPRMYKRYTSYLQQIAVIKSRIKLAKSRKSKKVWYKGILYSLKKSPNSTLERLLKEKQSKAKSLLAGYRVIDAGGAMELESPGLSTGWDDSADAPSGGVPLDAPLTPVESPQQLMAQGGLLQDDGPDPKILIAGAAVVVLAGALLILRRRSS